MISLEDLARNTEALTFLNALKVTLTQLKSEIQTQEELRDYHAKSADRVKKLMKKADAQYRLFAKIVTKESPFATDVTIDDTIPENYEQMKELMEQ